jgi:sugar (pentulose or hexulose) kinase
VERLETGNSAALGAALIAAAADGWQMDSLQAAFCRAEAGSGLAPDPSLGPVYEDAGRRFGELLDDTIHGR